MRGAACLNIFVHSRDLIGSSLQQAEQNGEWFDSPARGAPSLHEGVRVTALILGSEMTVVLFLKMHLMVFEK